MGKVRPMAPGAAGTADAWKRHDELARAIRGVNADRAADPAAAMIAQSPAVAEARSALNAALSDPNTDRRFFSEISSISASRQARQCGSCRTPTSTISTRDSVPPRCREPAPLCSARSKRNGSDGATPGR
jgi:hypothetical protein